MSAQRGKGGAEQILKIQTAQLLFKANMFIDKGLNIAACKITKVSYVSEVCWGPRNTEGLLMHNVFCHKIKL